MADDLETDGDRATARVTMSYRIRGIRRPFVTPRRLALRRESVGWRVTRDAPRREPLPWEVAAFRADRSRDVVLLTPPGVDAGELRPGLEGAYREIRRDLPSRDLPDRVLVIAARDAAQAERLNGRLARGVVALANVSVALQAAPGAAGRPRAVAADDRRATRAGATLAPADRQSTLVHEMTHTAMDPDTSGRTPAWLVEGLAMYVSERRPHRRGDRARRGRWAERPRSRPISRPNAIFRLGGEAQGAAYAAASAAAHAIVAEHGDEGAVPRSTTRSTTRGSAAGRARRLTDRVMRRTHRDVARRARADRSPAERLCHARTMPELPEVETIRRHLAPHVEGRVLTALEVRDARWCRPLAGDEVAAAVEGRRVEALGRRGKYLIWELEDDVHLMLHLRMTGTLLLDPPEPPRHARVRFALDDGRELIFDDPRRFGTGELALGGAARDAFFAARLGVEPFSPDFTSAHLYALTRVEPRADQGVPARPAQGRRRGEHLRRRGAVPRADPPAAPRARGSPASRSRRCATASSRRWRRGWRRRARRSTTSAIPTASRAPSRTAS